MSCSEFHLFGCLPAELRLKIWALARPPARLIHAIRTTHMSTESSRGDICIGRYHLGIICQSAPSVLQACRESRALLLPTYTSGFTSSRTLFPVQYPPRRWQPFGRRGHPAYHRDEMSNVFFPCHHEALVSNKNKSIYWDPENDIVFLHTEIWPMVQDKLLTGAVSLWSGHGWTAPIIHGVKKLALEFSDFTEWVLGIAEHDPIFGEPKVVYVIMDRKTIGEDEEWKSVLSRFMCWYQQRRITNPRGFVEERKFEWEVKIVARCYGELGEGAFEGAVSEHDIQGWKDYPHVGQWRAGDVLGRG
ncbi:hypothetical protein L207DRAFT_507823 [Hyaloscypha variabilis F]|uniref:2EXR domain-containing protein n=1 Tax=Hyaloscypha variabilis (strain UAMH 11265 / GT02V1 / F) TaxID=1149755 RepID=A0A2J6S2A4_HYAVF|nr:hypothetical protein L207DRAFT_507823 [Hyaloscypha variabilis F]